MFAVVPERTQCDIGIHDAMGMQRPGKAVNLYYCLHKVRKEFNFDFAMSKGEEKQGYF